jgi:hypothetical protein
LPLQLFFPQHFVNDTIGNRIVGAHPVIPVCIFLYLIQKLPGMLGKYPVQLVLEFQDLFDALWPYRKPDLQLLPPADGSSHGHAEGQNVFFDCPAASRTADIEAAAPYK